MEETIAQHALDERTATEHGRSNLLDSSVDVRIVVFMLEIAIGLIE